MRPPPTKPFAIIFLSALGFFILWGIVGWILEPHITDPALQKQIGQVVFPIAFGLFLVSGFSVVPVFVRLFFRLFFRMQKAVGNPDHPLVKRLQEKELPLSAILIYVLWAIYALGTLIAAPFFLKEMTGQ